MSKGQRSFRVLAAGAAAIVVVVCLLASSQLAPQRLLLEQDGMAIGSGGMPLSMSGGDDTAASAPASNPFLDAMDAQGLRATGGNALASNPFLDAMESSVVAARSLRQQMGGPSMRESVGRAQLHQLPAKQRAVEAAAAAATLKAYERQEAALRAQASQQLAATPEVSGMALGSGGRPLPMHLDVPAGADAQAKSQQAKMLALFDRLSPQTQHLLLQQKSGLSLQEAAAATERQIQVCLEPPPFILILRVARRWALREHIASACARLSVDGLYGCASRQGIRQTQ